MKRNICKNIAFLISVVILISSHSIAFSQESQSTLKVMTYNIWNGFEYGKDTDRKDKLIAWVKSQNPDVLALQELNDYTQEKLLADAKKWGHSYAEILKTSGYPVGITSSKPIEVKEKIMKNMHHGALHCEIDGIDFFIIHFSPHSYQKRQEESKIIIKKLSKLSKEQNKFIVLGDFNAVSPFDADLYKNRVTFMNLLKEAELQHSHIRNLFNGELEYGVIGSLLAYPLIDVTQKFTSGYDERVSCPTQVFETEKGDGRPERSKRIDFILVSPFLSKKCINAKVLNQKETYYLSDHYPVMAEFNFEINK
jgi:exodeoxyribonuclease III